MKKTPTLFIRSTEDRRHVIDQLNPDCLWVVRGEGVATRKYDGNCFMLDDEGSWWARREVKPGRPEPDGYQVIGTDFITGKKMGWEPVKNSPFWRHLGAAACRLDHHKPGTYELCGPHINGNPEGYNQATLIRHDDAEVIHDVPVSFDGLRGFMASFPHEGIVWHHPDGRRAKLKRRDFGYGQKDGML